MSRRRLTRLVGSVLVLTLVMPVAQAFAWSPSVRVNDDATNTKQVSPDVALGSGGAAIAV